jgi:hypothetical protein
MTVDEVKVWYVWGGIGHAVMQIGGGWIWTACGTMCSGDRDNVTSDKPKRICRRCRAAILTARPVPRTNQYTRSELPVAEGNYIP